MRTVDFLIWFFIVVALGIGLMIFKDYTDNYGYRLYKPLYNVVVGFWLVFILLITIKLSRSK